MSIVATRSLRGVAEIALGRQRSPEHDIGPDMVSYLRAANVKDGHLDLSDVKQMNFDSRDQVVFSLRPGDILVTEGSGSFNSVGASAVWHGEISGTVCFQNTLLRLRPRPGTDSRFLAWWSQQAYLSGRFASVAGGANIFHLGADRVRGLPVWLPEPARQRGIADYLDTETELLDALIDGKRRMIGLLDDREASLLSEALLPDGPSRAGGAWPWLTSLDSSLPLVALGHVASIQSGLTIDAGRQNDPSTVRRPYLRVANVQDGYLNLDEITEVQVPEALARRCELLQGDVLMTEGGDADKLGRGTVWDAQIAGCLHQNHIFAIRPATGVLNADYLALMMQTYHGRWYFEATCSRSVNLASTNASKVRAFPIPLPSLDHQVALVRAVHGELQQSGKMRQLIGRQIELLIERRQALITAAVTGELEIPGAAA